MAISELVPAEQGESGLGLEDQRQRINAEAQRRGWTVRIIEDAGYSAKDLSRPGITAVLAMLRNKEAGALVVSKLDRLSRSLMDFVALRELRLEPVGSHASGNGS